MKTKKHFLTILATLAMILLSAGQNARGAENGWTINSSTSGSVTTFTISRTNTAVAETVRFRLVNLSAYAGQHYNVTQVNGQSSNALTGEFTFAAGDATSRTVTVTEQAALTDAYKYQTGTTRNYKLELTDAGGFYLTSNTRSFTTGTSINSTNAFGAKEVDVNTGTITVTDDNYSQAYHAVPVATYFNSAAPKNYLVAAGAELRMTLSFQAKEKDDGYQHVQILVNQTSNHDEESGDNNPGTMNYSSYMATFCHKGGSTNTTYSNYVFPDVSHNNNCGNVGLVWSSINSTNDVGELRQQYFNTDCRATDGRLIIAGKSALSSFSTLGIRFDASGNNEDTWYAYNVKAKIQAVDATAPTVIAYSVAPGRHSKGNTVYVSVAFSEIVTTSSAKLTSNWGDLSYVAGSGTNVLTFSRTIPASASDAFNITGFSGITDLAGKAPSSVTASNLCLLNDSYAYTITYDLDGGTLATENHSTYTYETATFTLNNPTRLGYYFDGWTGSNGNTTQTTVTIANHSHENKTFTANWTKVWNGKGTSGEPYIITTTKGLDLLAMYVNGLGGNSAHDCSEVYFQLGGDITYTHTTVWNNASSTENNYTSIGTYAAPFKGTFDGQDHTVSGIRIYKAADFDQGLFGRISSGGTVRRVNLANARITGRIEVGGVAGYIFSSTVEDCSVAADVCIHSVGNYYFYYHGGIVGFNEGTVQRCLSRATLSAATASYCQSYGAIVGTNNDATVLDCIAVGATAPSVSRAGAIVGESNHSTYNVRRNYYRACTVAGTANATGVGVGYHSSNTSPHDITDNQGAQALYSITLPGDVTLVRTASATLPGTGNATYTTGADIDGVPYAYAGASLTLSYSGTAPEGYELTLLVNGASATPDGEGNWTFSMPADNVSVTVSTPAIPWEGKGTLEEPYIILYPSQLDLMATGVNSGTYQDSFFELGADLAYSTDNLGEDDSNYTPIGTGVAPFRGSFDGKGHIISGIVVKRTGSGDADSYIGLFGQISRATVQNVFLAGSTFTGYRYVGTIVGYKDPGSSLAGNYYAGCTVGSTGDAAGVGCGGEAADTSPHDITDGDGARRLGKLTLGDGVTATPDPAVSHDGKAYFAAGEQISLSHSGDGNFVVIKTDGSFVTDEVLSGTTLTMPDYDIAVRAGRYYRYIDEDGLEKAVEATPLTGSETEIGSAALSEPGWYIVDHDISFDHKLSMSGYVRLILADGMTLMMSCDGDNCIDAKSFIIYGQREGTGALTMSRIENPMDDTVLQTDFLTINGGQITANGSLYGGFEVTINGGNVNVTSQIYANDNVTINGGSVTASQIYANQSIYLGWTRASDRIYVNSYTPAFGTIQVRQGQKLWNGQEILTDYSRIYIHDVDGKTLRPYISGTVTLTLAPGTKDGVPACWGTFYHGSTNYTLSDGAAYTMDAEYHLYRLGTDGRTIPAGTPVVIIATSANAELIPAGSDPLVVTDHAPGGNILVGVDADTSFDTGIYVLSKNASGEVGFYPLVNGTLPAHRAGYLSTGHLKNYDKKAGQQW